jgi:hypothetical protein
LQNLQCRDFRRTISGQPARSRLGIRVASNSPNPDDAIVVVPLERLREGTEMSEERFARIDARLDRLEHGQEALRAGQEALRVGQDGLVAGQESLAARQDSLADKQDNLIAGQELLFAGQKSLVAGYDRLSGEITDLRRHMGVLHEEVLDRIQALAYDPEPLRREFRTADEGLLEELTRRIEPLEVAIWHKRRGR